MFPEERIPLGPSPFPAQLPTFQDAAYPNSQEHPSWRGSTQDESGIWLLDNKKEGFRKMRMAQKHNLKSPFSPQPRLLLTQSLGLDMQLNLSIRHTLQVGHLAHQGNRLGGKGP